MLHWNKSIIMSDHVWYYILYKIRYVYRHKYLIKYKKKNTRPVRIYPSFVCNSRFHILPLFWLSLRDIGWLRQGSSWTLCHTISISSKYQKHQSLIFFVALFVYILVGFTSHQHFKGYMATFQLYWWRPLRVSTCLYREIQSFHCNYTMNYMCLRGVRDWVVRVVHLSRTWIISLRKLSSKRRWFYSGVPVPEILHRGAPEVFLHQ